MKAGVLALVVLLGTSTVSAWPVLSEGRLTGEGYCFPDHDTPELWWMAPASMEPASVNGRPAVDFVAYRYQGTRAMGDSGRFYGGALVQFSLRMAGPADRLRRASDELGDGAEVRPLAPARLEAEVVFAGESSVSRRAVTGPSADPDTISVEGAGFSLALSPEETEVVRRAWEDGAVVLSVNVTAWALALSRRPLADEPVEPELLPVMAGAVPITVDPRRHPEVFQTLELDATMPAGYTTLDLGCAELTGPGGFEDIERVVVRAEAKAMNGDTIREQVRFDRESPEILRMVFDRAVRLDEGYRLFVHRVHATGEVEAVDERVVEVWRGFVDVCSRSAGDDGRLDPRLLY